MFLAQHPLEEWRSVSIPTLTRESFIFYHKKISTLFFAMRLFNDFIFYCAKFSVFFSAKCQYSISPQFKLSTLSGLTHDRLLLSLIHSPEGFDSFFSLLCHLGDVYVRRFPPIEFHLHTTYSTNSSPLSNFSLGFKPRRLQFLIAIFHEKEKILPKIFTGIFYSNWRIIIIYVLRESSVSEFMGRKRRKQETRKSRTIWNQ